MKEKNPNTSHYPRLLTIEEAARLLQDAKDSSAWMRAEIKRRRAAKPDDPAGEEK